MAVKPSDMFTLWRERGLSVRAANAVCSLQCWSLTDLRILGREAVMYHYGLGPPTFNEIADLVGWERRAKYERKPAAPPRAANAPVLSDDQVKLVLRHIGRGYES